MNKTTLRFWLTVALMSAAVLALANLQSARAREARAYRDLGAPNPAVVEANDRAARELSLTADADR
jgi:hypothetical protein